MSNVLPFEEGDHLPVVPTEESVFQEELAHVNWAAYERRQDVLNEALRSKTSVRDILIRFHAEDPGLGAKLNNIHNTEVTGDPIPGLSARLAVLSRTAVRLSLPGLDFRGGVAAEATLTGDLRGADFTDSVMPRVNLSGADLSGASMVNAILNGADLTGANLRGVDFAGAYLVGVRGLTKEQLETANLKGARAIIPPKAVAEKDLGSALASHFGTTGVEEDILDFMSPVPVAEKQKVPLLQTNHPRLRGLSGVDLVLNNVDFTASSMHGMTLENVTGRQLILREVHASGAIILRSVLDESDFHGLWVPGSIWEETSIKGANLTNANLVGSVFRGVDLRGVIGLGSKNTNVEGIIMEDCMFPQGYGYDGFALDMTDKVRRELTE